MGTSGVPPRWGIRWDGKHRLDEALAVEARCDETGYRDRFLWIPRPGDGNLREKNALRVNGALRETFQAAACFMVSDRAVSVMAFWGDRSRLTESRLTFARRAC